MVFGALAGLLLPSIFVAAAVSTLFLTRTIWRNAEFVRSGGVNDLTECSRRIDNHFIYHMILCVTIPATISSYIILYYQFLAEVIVDNNKGFVEGNILRHFTDLHSILMNVPEGNDKAILFKRLFSLIATATYIFAATLGALICAPALIRSWADRTVNETTGLNLIRVLLPAIVVFFTIQLISSSLDQACVTHVQPNTLIYTNAASVRCAIKLSFLPVILLMSVIAIGSAKNILWRDDNDRTK